MTPEPSGNIRIDAVFTRGRTKHVFFLVTEVHVCVCGCFNMTPVSIVFSLFLFSLLLLLFSSPPFQASAMMSLPELSGEYIIYIVSIISCWLNSEMTSCADIERNTIADGIIQGSWRLLLLYHQDARIQLAYPWFRLCKYDCYVILLYIVLIFDVDGIFLACLWP